MRAFIPPSKAFEDLSQFSVKTAIAAAKTLGVVNYIDKDFAPLSGL